MVDEYTVKNTGYYLFIIEYLFAHLPHYTMKKHTTKIIKRSKLIPWLILEEKRTTKVRDDQGNLLQEDITITIIN